MQLSLQCRAKPIVTFAAALLVLVVAATQSAGAERSSEELAKETQNPVANLISVPFQNNFNFNSGAKDAMVWVMNVQPVIPNPADQELERDHTHHLAGHQSTAAV